MPTFQDQTGPYSNLKAPIKNRNPRDGVAGSQKPILNGPVKWEDVNQYERMFSDVVRLIRQADTVRLDQVCKHYDIEIGGFNLKIVCPFPFHQDNSPSFTYYPETNSFHCFGCKSTGGSVQFVALIESIPKAIAAKKLLEGFESDEDEASPSSFIGSKERESLYLRFSEMVLSFSREHKSEEAAKFINGIARAFDYAMNGRGKRSVNIDGIKHTIDRLETLVKEYECR